MSTESNICDAIKIITEKIVNSASYDTTILGKIVSCVDATIGKYKVKYQDAVWYAYSSNTDVTYTAGSDVYVLIPGGDFNKEKTILGTSKKLGINYVNVIDGEEAYEYIGNNCVLPHEEFKLSSYKDEEIILYDSNKENNLLSLHIDSVNEYIRNASTIIFGAKFRTKLDIEQRFQGEYGIKYILQFTDNSTGALINREFLLDINKMSGNPYSFTKAKRQYGIYDIDYKNFVKVEKISIFVKDFPLSKENIKEEDYDIFINDIEIQAAERLSEADLGSYSLSLITPQGSFFDSINTDLENEEKIIEAQVKVKGKVIDSNSQSLEFYWFVEHNGIDSTSQYYNKNGGLGWKCLNDYNILKAENVNEPDVVEWISGSAKKIIKRKDIQAKEVKYKCIAIYDGKVLSDTIVIKNLGSEYTIIIESSNGTQFYYDTGRTSLTCLVKKGDTVLDANSFTYAWAVENNLGFNTMPETPGANNTYNSTLATLEGLEKIKKEKGYLTQEQQQEVDQCRDLLTIMKNSCRIEENKVYDIQINTIVGFSNYKCSVYDLNGVFIGTASIVITNSLESVPGYSLVINEGSQIYKYDENGVSPANGSVENPINIKTLTFTIYDNLGNAIDDEVARTCEIHWLVPFEGSMIEIPDGLTPSEVDNVNKINTYSNIMSFSYDIAERYNIDKSKNTIELRVKYKDIQLIAYTNFTFVKEGESGTNGTNFVCKIVPNAQPSYNVEYPAIVNGQLNYATINDGKWFRVQLWENEIKVFENTDSLEDDKITVKWSILKNKYTSSLSDASSINYDGSKFSSNNYNINNPTADVVKASVKYDGKMYYATLPIPSIQNETVRNEKGTYKYNCSWKKGTGFQYAVYSSDGHRPKYSDTYPFEIVVKEQVDGGTWEDISLSKELTYTWRVLGGVYNSLNRNEYIGGIWTVDNNNTNFIEGTYLKAESGAVEINQQKFKVLDPYDGYCLNSAVECIISKNGYTIGKVRMPVHLMLNRYGFGHLNDWDGNSVKISEEEGYILSPQIGAGVKENDNSFTGVLMGKVEGGYKGSSAIGIIGYAQGQRSIFLDAETGKAEFGVTGKGQILIEPSKTKAIIKSGNYDVSSKTGLLIDLTTPEIKFGSGNFNVNSSGHLTAKGGGEIAGWKISDSSLSANNIRIGSDGSIKHTDGDWSINSDGSASFSDIRVTGGSINVNNAFIVNSDGKVTASDMHITGGTITVGSNFQVKNDGSVTASSITINGGYIKFGNFEVDKDGNLTASNVNLTGTITATGGKIGDWTISANGLTYGEKIYMTSGGISTPGLTVQAANVHFADIDQSAKDVYDTASEGELRSRQNEKDITALETLVSNISTKVKELAGDITDIKGDIKSLENRLDNHSHGGGNSDE